MTNGDAWEAVNELRVGHTRHERELGALAKGQQEVERDVNSLGDEIRKSRHDLRSAMTAMEGRLMAEMKERTAQTDQRLTDLVARWRQAVVVIAPIAMTIIGWLIGRG